jgi:transcription elongation factor Elf1
MTLDERYKEVWEGKHLSKSIPCIGCKTRHTSTFKATDKYIVWVCSVCGIHNSIFNQLNKTK